MKQFYLTIGQRPVGAHRSAKTKTRLALQLVPAMTILVALAISIPMSAQTVTTFDSLDAGTGPFQGTYAFNIAPSGMIIGFTRDANNVRHGFLRSKKGNFTGFDAPRAGTAAGQGMRAYAVNPSGEITGFFLEPDSTAGGYVRSRQGVITVFDAPGAGTGPSHGTYPFSPLIINPNGAIAGYYVVSCAIRMAPSPRSTLRARAWTLGQGLYPFSIAPNGAMTGYSNDANNLVHCFVVTE